MKPEAINVAIARAVGWKDISWIMFSVSRGVISRLRGSLNDKIDTIPNYHGDLNAMAEAEAKLSNNEYRRYREILDDVVFRDFKAKAKQQGRASFMDACRTSATAAQRSEAFLRVKDLWVDGRDGE